MYELAFFCSSSIPVNSSPLFFFSSSKGRLGCFFEGLDHVEKEERKCLPRAFEVDSIVWFQKKEYHDHLSKRVKVRAYKKKNKQMNFYRQVNERQPKKKKKRSNRVTYKKKGE